MRYFQILYSAVEKHFKGVKYSWGATMDATIIHLSDLHFKNDADNRLRLQLLRKDLQRISTVGPVFTAFTGDLIYAGDENSYELLFEELIGPLIDFGHEVLVVPGNHDIQRKVASPEFANQCLTDRGSGYLFDSSGNIQHPYLESTADPLTNYHFFEELFGPYDHYNYWGYSRTIGGVSFVGLNSTWLSVERKEGDSDQGQLRVEPHILEELAKNLPEDTLKVVLLHHPLDWLEETSRDAVSKLITAYFDLALFGHLHTSNLANLAHGTSNCLYVQSPPLRAGWSKGTNGYSIITSNIENKKYEIEYRSYSDSRRVFVIGEDFAPLGRLHPRPEDAEFFRTSPSEQVLLQKYKDGAPYDYTNWYQNNILAKSNKVGSFIVPKARKIQVNQEDNRLEAAEAITEIVKKSSRDQFFVAPMDAGSTTAAYLVFKELSEAFNLFNKVPAFFDAGDEKINKASILRAINRTSLTKFSHEEVSRLAESGAVTVIIDGLSLADAEQFNLFRGTAKKFFPRARFIYFLSTERRGVVEAVKGGPDLQVERDEIYEFSQLEVSDIRAMAKLQSAEFKQDVLDALVAQVIESFRQMDEPIFASSIAVVVQTLSQYPEFKPLNKARLLERYVECLLGRFDIEDVQEGIFASSDKIDLLSFIAREMLETDLLGVSEEDWQKLCNSYQKQYLIELPPKLLKEFIEKGLLTMSGGKITFRGDYLFSFFVARQMKADLDFASTLLDGDGIFKYHREIVFYGELEGTDTRSVLNSINLVISEVKKVLLDNYSSEGINLVNEWANSCAETKDETSDTAAFSDATNKLIEAEPTPEHADRISDNQLAQVHRRRGIAERVAVQEAEAKLLVAIKLYALLLKNALQVPAKDKLQHLEKLYAAAEVWVGFLCSLRSEVSIRPIVIAGGIRFLNYGAAIDAEKSKKEFKYNAPNSMSRILSEAIRNPQLAVALRHVLPKLNSMGSLFARDALLEIAGSDNRQAYMDSLTQETDLNLKTSSLRTLRDRFLASGRSKDQRTHIEKMVNEVEKQTSGSINFERLRKARMVRDMKENAGRKRLEKRKSSEE